MNRWMDGVEMETWSTSTEMCMYEVKSFRRKLVACCVVVSLTELKSIYTVFILLDHRHCRMKHIAVIQHTAAFQIYVFGIHSHTFFFAMQH